MGIFARAATKAFDQGVGTLAAGSHVAQLVGGGRSASGITVTPDRALSFGPFWAGVRILAESVAVLPLAVFEKTGDKTRRDASDYPLHRVIRGAANPQMPSYRWRETAMAHLVVWGNHYSLIARDGIGRIRELWPLAPERMIIERDSETGELRYRYTRLNGTNVPLMSADVLHIPGLSWDGVKGLSAIRYYREAIGLGLAAQEFGARFFDKGALSSFALTHPKTLSDVARTNLRRSLDEEHSGEQAWRPWLLEEGMTATVLSMPNDDAQWLETRKYQRGEIATMLRLPPHKLGDLDRATFSNIEHQSLEFVQDALLSWITRWEEEMGLQLLGEDWLGLGGRFYIKFNLNALVRADIKSRYESYGLGRQWGFLTPDQIAALEDWDPVPGDGDVRLRPLNMTAESAFDENGMTFRDRIEGAGILVRAGYDPESALTALNLPAIPHSGLVPVTVQAASLTELRSLPAGGELRCASCKHLLAERIAPPYRIVCRHCDMVNEAA